MGGSRPGRTENWTQNIKMKEFIQPPCSIDLIRDDISQWVIMFKVSMFYFFSDQLKGHLMKSKSSSPDFGQSH